MSHLKQGVNQIKINFQISASTSCMELKFSRYDLIEDKDLQTFKSVYAIVFKLHETAICWELQEVLTSNLDRGRLIRKLVDCHYFDLFR